MEYRFPYGYDVDAASLESGLECKDPSLADQAGAADTDINTIVRRFNLTGELPLTKRVPYPYAVDVDEILDYRTCLDRINAAAASFASLPAHVRSEFENDPGKFVTFAENPDNLEKMREWGLAPAAAVAPSSPPA